MIVQGMDERVNAIMVLLVLRRSQNSLLLQGRNSESACPGRLGGSSESLQSALGDTTNSWNVSLDDAPW